MTNRHRKECSRYRRSAHGLQLFSLAEKRDSLGSSPRNKETWPLGQGLLVDKWDMLSSIVTYFFAELLRAFNMLVCQRCDFPKVE